MNSITTFVSDRAFAERVAAFHRAHPVESGQRQVEQSIERMLMGVGLRRARPTRCSPRSSPAERRARVSVGTVLTVFVVIAIAELPDKTMIATRPDGLARRRRCGSGSARPCAFLVHVGFAVVAGQLLTRLPHTALEVVVTVLFLGGAAYLLLVPEREEEERGEREAAGERDRARRRSVALSAFGVILVGEFGDLTQLLTVNFVAKTHEPASVALGARRGPARGLGARGVLRPRARPRRAASSAIRRDRRGRPRRVHRVLDLPSSSG